LAARWWILLNFSIVAPKYKWANDKASGGFGIEWH